MSFQPDASEGVVRIKRSHTDAHPEIRAEMNAPLRNKLVSFLGGSEGGKVHLDDWDKYCQSLEEDEEVGRAPHGRWLSRNSHIIKKVNYPSGTHVRLTRAGQNIYKALQDAVANQEEGEKEEEKRGGGLRSTILPDEVFADSGQPSGVSEGRLPSYQDYLKRF